MLALHHMNNINTKTKNKNKTPKNATISSAPITTRIQELGSFNKRISVPVSPTTGNAQIDSLNLFELQARDDLESSPSTRGPYRQRRAALSKVEAVTQTNLLLERRRINRVARVTRRRENRGKIMSESEIVGEMTTGAVGNTEVHGNLVDSTGEMPDEVSAGVKPSPVDDGGKTQLPLDAFFERPVSIYDSSWPTGAEQNVILDPWNLWSRDASVRAKISNYAFFRATLHVKISVTGTPYHFGRVMASYQPFGGFNDNLIQYDFTMLQTVPTTAQILPLYKAYLSQAPGVGYLDIKENEPLEMEIPFISQLPKFRLFNDSPDLITNSTDFTDFLEAGQLRLVTLNTPEIANDDFDSEVSVNVYAWMTGVELGSITSTDINITAQAAVITSESDPKVSPLYSEEGSFGTRLWKSIEAGPDEYEEPGPVTKWASALTASASIMSMAPYIGPFAKATATVSGGIAAVASMFGWSKPVVLTDPTFVKNVPFQNGAFTSGKETAYKLTADPKQELSVDQRLGGHVDDQMTFAAMAGRESFLTTFTWDDDDTALSTVLWKSLVTPFLFTSTTYSTGGTPRGIVQPTAMDMAATPFSAWRGKIRFRFEVVCSRFHRGKIMFKYEPNVPQSALITSNNAKLNQQNAIILDIQEAQDITIEVDWAMRNSWGEAPIEHKPSEPPSDIGSLPAVFDGFRSNLQANGNLQVRVLNELVQPTPTSGVSVNVYVSCPDLELNRMTSMELPTDRTIYSESELVTINDTGSQVSPAMFLDHFGERLVSFRSLMKRYTTSAYAFKNISITGPAHLSVVGTLYPETALRTNAPTPSSVNATNLFQYLRAAYMGVRGGMRYRITQFTNAQVTNSDYVRVSLGFHSEPVDTALSADADLVNGIADLPILGARLDGSVLSHLATNGGVEFEVPFYSHARFLYSFNSPWDPVSATDPQPATSWAWEALFGATITSGDSAAFTVDSATAEDFTFLRFQGSPPYGLSGGSV